MLSNVRTTTYFTTVQQLKNTREKIITEVSRDAQVDSNSNSNQEETRIDLSVPK